MVEWKIRFQPDIRVWLFCDENNPFITKKTPFIVGTQVVWNQGNIFNGEFHIYYRLYDE
jgi:hypothetical protein